MNPVSNPYMPGSGQSPPVMAGRDALRERVQIGLARLRTGRSAKSVLMVGLRGVGKTVLLEQMRSDAKREGAGTLCIENPEQCSLPALLAPQLRTVLLRLSGVQAARETALCALTALAVFTQALEGPLKNRLMDLDFDTEAAGLAGLGQMEGGPATLLERTGLAARQAQCAVVLFIDEFQCIAPTQLASLIVVMHRCAQARTPIMVVGAGLPQLRSRVGHAKAYAERLFDYPVISPLSGVDAALAIAQAAAQEGVAFEAAGVDLMVERTGGYPFFLQAWASQAWNMAIASPISLADVKRAWAPTLVALDEGFFRVFFDRLTPAEKRYLRAMAELGPGTHRSGEIADGLGRRVQAVAPLRKGLICKGVIWSPGHGDTAFTVPFFDEFMQRIMPSVGSGWGI
ncbi:ATP-binding protein [Pseudomonas thivervalensis]|uniref:ATP-binding protein n=1 Tax=Pseudomonas thivervalensis TaxID=86265 RepID=UPI00069E71AF|nr:ATP-binding protein [Pseudomonas thivervalensis]